MNNLLSFFTDICELPLWGYLILSIFAGIGAALIPCFIIQVRKTQKAYDQQLQTMLWAKNRSDEVNELQATLEKQESEIARELEILNQAKVDYEEAKQLLEETIADLEKEKQDLAKETAEMKNANIHRQGLLAALKAQTETIRKEKKALAKAKKKIVGEEK